MYKRNVKIKKIYKRKKNYFFNDLNLIKKIYEFIDNSKLRKTL
jgi:hypothetical protein